MKGTRRQTYLFKSYTCSGHGTDRTDKLEWEKSQSQSLLMSWSNWHIRFFLVNTPVRASSSDRATCEKFTHVFFIWILNVHKTQTTCLSSHRAWPPITNDSSNLNVSPWLKKKKKRVFSESLFQCETLPLSFPRLNMSPHINKCSLHSLL